VLRRTFVVAVDGSTMHTKTLRYCRRTGLNRNRIARVKVEIQTRDQIC